MVGSQETSILVTPRLPAERMCFPKQISNKTVENKGTVLTWVIVFATLSVTSLPEPKQHTS